MSDPHAPDEPCQGPHPCPGCDQEITAREICCSPCFLWLPPQIKIGLWKTHDHTPEFLAEVIHSAKLHFLRKPRSVPGVAS